MNEIRAHLLFNYPPHTRTRTPMHKYARTRTLAGTRVLEHICTLASSVCVCVWIVLAGSDGARVKYDIRGGILRPLPKTRPKAWHTHTHTRSPCDTSFVYRHAVLFFCGFFPRLTAYRFQLRQTRTTPNCGRTNWNPISVPSVLALCTMTSSM